jgi:hypothetical protein
MNLCSVKCLLFCVMHSLRPTNNGDLTVLLLLNVKNECRKVRVECSCDLVDSV